MNTLRDRLASIDPARDTEPYSADASARVVRRILAQEEWASHPRAVEARTPDRGRRRGHRLPVAAAAALLTLTIGGVAIAELRPVDDVASAPLAPPVIVSGVGPAEVTLPPVPPGARYVHVELTCFSGTLCSTPAGSIEGPPSPEPKVERGALPVTPEPDGDDQQSLAPLDPAAGLPVIVDPGSHWRLYAVYSDGFDPQAGRLADGTVFGIPGIEMPDFVPAVATNGEVGWVSYRELTHDARPVLTDTGVRQEPLPVYAGDGTTVIGTVDVSATVTDR